MIIDEKTYHTINQYLNDELVGSKLDQFKAKLKSDTSLKKAVASQAAIVQGVKAARTQELKQYLRSHVGSTKSMWSISPAIKTGIAAAAAIALLVGTYYAIAPLWTSSDATAQNTTTQNTTTQEDTAPLYTIDTAHTTADTQTLAAVTPSSPSYDELEPSLEEASEDYEQDEEEILEKNALPATTTTTEERYYVENHSSTGQPELLNSKYDVVSDLLVSSRAYTVSGISPNFDRESDLVEVQNRDAEVSSKRGKLFRNKKKDKEPKKENNQTKETAAAPTSRNIQVEYWKSVVNYKGYSYDGANVKLYGIEDTQPISFKELDSRLYINLEGKHYFIEKNNKHNRLVEVTNATLLKVLHD